MPTATRCAGSPRRSHSSLSVVVAVLPAGSSSKSSGEDLADFSALGCPVVAYQQSGKEPRSGPLARVAAI
jgi:hypothetical protein